jgi:methionyl-tRNA formyltransferase
MRVALIGQQDFGKAVLEAFLARKDTVAGVFCAPENPGEGADPLSLAAEQAGIPTFRFGSLRGEEAKRALSELNADLAVLAYVLQFVPQDFTSIPVHGTIQYHPSLLPRHRGPSSINWPIILGDTRTGLTIFRPTDGLDEGPIILQKETHIGADDTLGKVYFDRLFPMGVAALLEAADLVVSGKAEERVQDETLASYAGWCREAEAQIHWHTHIEQIYNLVRGCNPAPGAWTKFRGKRLRFFDAAKLPARTYSKIKGSIGAVTAIGEKSFTIAASGGELEVFRVRYEGGKKISAPQFCAEAGLGLGTLLGE